MNSLLNILAVIAFIQVYRGALYDNKKIMLVGAGIMIFAVIVKSLL